MKYNLLDLLNEKLKPALGCTEPIAIALAGAEARFYSKGKFIRKIVVRASGNIIKNAMGVMLPTVNESGIDLAVTLGVLSSDNHSLKLEVLNGIDRNKIDQAKSIIASGIVKIEVADTEKKLYIEVVITTEKDEVKVVIEDEHTNITLIEVNGEKISRNEDNRVSKGVGNNYWDGLKLDDILDFVDTVKIVDLEIVKKSIELNKEISQEGLEHKYGLEIGRNIVENIENGYYCEDIQKNASYVTAAGSDARMGGATMTVMSNSGSGNQGIVATLPVVAVGEKLNVDNEVLIKGVTLSHLITIYMKMQFGVLSAFCGAAVAGIGASSGIVYILGGTKENIKMTINNMIGNITGMVCDGAKPGCALKVSQVTNAAVDSALLSLNGKRVSGLEGIVAENVEESIKNFTRISREASTDIDKIILDAMLNK